MRASNSDVESAPGRNAPTGAWNDLDPHAARLDRQRVRGTATSSNARAGATATADTVEPVFAPAPGNMSGRVTKATVLSLIVKSEAGEHAVDLSNVVGVWRDTQTSASDIGIGDDVIINGTNDEPFRARYIWINIANIKGTILSVDSAGMTVAIGSAGVAERIEFSPYVVFGSADGTVRTTRADLVPGRAVGAIVYRPRAGAPRATRVW